MASEKPYLEALWERWAADYDLGPADRELFDVACLRLQLLIGLPVTPFTLARAKTLLAQATQEARNRGDRIVGFHVTQDDGAIVIAPGENNG